VQRYQKWSFEKWEIIFKKTRQEGAKKRLRMGLKIEGKIKKK
jgi:hypothetical protein